MGCVKLHILDEQYKNTELKVCYFNKELTSDFCAENPRRWILVNRIDPDGRDVWEINENGEIVQRIKDKTQDAFYMVQKDGDGNYQRTYKKDKDGNDVLDKDGNKQYNSISFEYGTVESQFSLAVNVGGNIENVDLFKVKGDDNATQLFEYLANPGSTTTVEWSHAKIGRTEGDKGQNLIGTSHQASSTAAGGAIMGYGYSVRELNHNHPSGNNTPSNRDITNRNTYLQRNPNIRLNVYSTTRGYRPYATLEEMTRYYPPIIH